MFKSYQTFFFLQKKMLFFYAPLSSKPPYNICSFSSAVHKIMEATNTIMTTGTTTTISTTTSTATSKIQILLILNKFSETSSYMKNPRKCFGLLKVA